MIGREKTLWLEFTGQKIVSDHMTDLASASSLESPLDTAACALCGGPNQCALAADPDATECWCDSVTFDDALLARVPDIAVRKVCICQKCLIEHQESGFTQ
jgi:hypothetical protein